MHDDGICDACHSHGQRNEVNWTKREEQFQELVQYAKSKSKGYDCLIPVSGGKDSTWQVIKCLEYGLYPLTVTWRPQSRTEIGQKNLDNLIRLGVDHIDYSINPNVEKVFLRKAYRKYGSVALPMHMAMFNIPLRTAVSFDIPVVVWGENSAAEYGGEEEVKGFLMNSKWLEKYGVTHGTKAVDWIDDELTEIKMTPYFGPSDQEMEDRGIRAIFLGYYFEWDPETSLRVATENGFQVREEGPKVGYYNYADIDDDFISIHHYLKWQKFGITRTWDNLSLEIRNGRMTRDEALEYLRKRGDETPHEDIETFCQYTGISKSEFFEIAGGFRNLDIWEKVDGRWRIKDYLIKNWIW